VEIVDTNIAQYLEHKRVLRMGVSQEKILTVQEVKLILEQAQENPRDFALIAMLYYAGLRKGEAQQLVWGDIDFEGRHIYIRKGKGDKPRDVTLNSDLARILRDYQDRTGDRIGYVFKSAQGNHMSPHTIDYTIHKYAARAHISKNVHAHMFRHSHATHRIEHQDDVKRVSMDLGHESVQITYDLYVHPTQEAREQGIDACLPSFL
jgi:integrase/recombinase XerD